MNKLRIAVRSFADFETALSAQLRAFDGTVEVEVTTVELRELEQLMLGGEFQAGRFDLAIFPTDWVGPASNGALERLSHWMERTPPDNWPEGWPQSLLDPLRRNRDFYCVPWHDGPECLIYRTDLFGDEREQAAFSARTGLPLAPPATWGEFHKIARFFTRPEQALYGTLFAALPDGHNTLYDLLLQVWSRGGELYDADGRATLSDPIVAEALDFYRAIIRDAGACYPGAQEIDSVHSGDVFLSGQVAMMVNWFGFAARCAREDSPLRGKVALAPIPGGRPGQTASLSNYWVVGISSGSRSKEDAYKLLRHLASAEMDKLTTLSGAVGVRLSTWRDVEVLERIPLYGQLEALSATARTLPFCPDLPKLAEIVNRVTVDALTSDEASASILSRAQEEAERMGLRLSCDGAPVQRKE